MITKRQKQILDFIVEYQRNNIYSPSLEEICKKFKLASVSTAHFHVSNLHNAGYLDKEENKPRGIDATKQEEIIKIPIIGTIAAGKPIEIIDVPVKTISISKREINPSEKYYALCVQGDSMINEGIFEGDVVVIRKQEKAEAGQTVVAIIDGNEATLKKIFKEKGGVRLQSANQDLLPFFRKKVEIRGVVVKIIRNFEENNKNTLAKRKKEFLDKIRSVNTLSQNKYKRVALSPIRYAGGKSLAVGHVVELIPENIIRIVSPFFGGGSIEIAIDKYLGLEVIGFDIFDILCNYWKYQIEKPELLYKRLKEMKPEKEFFEKIRLILNDVWKKKIELDPLTLAVYYVYNFNLSYGPGFMGWASDIYLDEIRYRRMIERIRDFKPNNLKVECADFRNVIKKYTEDFLYCDPPYYIGKDSKMFKGIYPMRNIPVHHNGFPHETLRDLLKNHKGGFILSYNNCPTIREYYQEFQQFFPSWQYTMGQGETRIGLNRINNNGSHVKTSHEIIIFCPPKN